DYFLCFSPDAWRFATWSWAGGGTVTVRDGTTGGAAATFPSAGGITTAALSRDGKVLAAVQGGRDRHGNVRPIELTVWDVDSGQCLRSIGTLSPRTLISAIGLGAGPGCSPSAAVLLLMNSSPVCEPKDHVTHLALSPDGRLLAYGTHAGRLGLRE